MMGNSGSTCSPHDRLPQAVFKRRFVVGNFGVNCHALVSVAFVEGCGGLVTWATPSVGMWRGTTTRRYLCTLQTVNKEASSEQGEQSAGDGGAGWING